MNRPAQRGPQQEQSEQQEQQQRISLLLRHVFTHFYVQAGNSRWFTDQRPVRERRRLRFIPGYHCLVDVVLNGTAE